MRTASGLTLIAIGAILAFAVTTTPPGFNLHIAGWVLIVVGLIGMFMPAKKGYGWLRRRVVLRPGPGGPVPTQVDETHYPRSIVRYPDSAPVDDEQPSRKAWTRNRWARRSRDPFQRVVRGETTITEPTMPGESETIEEFSQE